MKNSKELRVLNVNIMMNMIYSVESLGIIKINSFYSSQQFSRIFFNKWVIIIVVHVRLAVSDYNSMLKKKINISK